MIGVLTHHWANQGMLEQARALLDGNAGAQSRAPGFVGRTSMTSATDSIKLSSLVIWESEELYDAWKASPQRAAAMAGAGELWARPPESERFAVTARLSPEK